MKKYHYILSLALFSFPFFVGCGATETNSSFDSFSKSGSDQYDVESIQGIDANKTGELGYDENNSSTPDSYNTSHKDNNSEIGQPGVDSPEPRLEPNDPSKSKGDNNFDPASGLQPLFRRWPLTLSSYFSDISAMSEINSIGFSSFHSLESSQKCCRAFGEASKRPGINNAVAKLQASFGFSTDASSSSMSINSLLKDVFNQHGHKLVIDHYFDKQFFNQDNSKKRPFIADVISLSPSENGIIHYNGQSYLPDMKNFGEDIQIDSSDRYIPNIVSNPSVYVDNTIYLKFENWTLPVPIGHTILNLPIHDVQIKNTIGGVHVDTAKNFNNISYHDAKLSGFVLLDDIFETLNKYVSENCTCRGKIEPLYTRENDGSWSVNCDQDAYFACSDSLSSICQELLFKKEIPSNNFSCESISAKIKNAADIDSSFFMSFDNRSIFDDQVQWDALSIGYLLNATSIRFSVGH